MTTKPRRQLILYIGLAISFNAFAGYPVVFDGVTSQYATQQVSEFTGETIQDFETHSFQDLLKSSSVRLVGDGGTVSECTSTPTSNNTVRDAIKRAKASIDYMDDQKATAHLRAGITALGCQTDVIDNDTAAELYFLSGFLEYAAGHEAKASNSFRNSSIFDPELRWDNNFSPEALPHFEKSKLSLASDKGSPIRVSPTPPDGTFWVNGNPKTGDTSDLPIGQSIIQLTGEQQKTVKIEVTKAGNLELLLASLIPEDALSRFSGAPKNDHLKALFKSHFDDGQTMYIVNTHGTWSHVVGSPDWQLVIRASSIAPQNAGLPVTGAVSPVAAASVGEGVNKDVSAKLAEQACGEEASRKGADVRDTKLDEEARAPLAEAKAAWEAMASLLETCSHLEYSERNTCIVAAEQWIAASEKLTVTIPAGVELVPTACGEREAVFAETQRSVAVLELVAARQMLERLRATLIPEPSPPTKATEIPSQCPWASAGRAHTTTTMGYVFINGQRYGVRGAEARSAFETILTACGGRDAIEPFQSWRKSRRRTNTVIMVYPLAFFPALAAGKHRNALLLALNASTPPPGRPATIPDVSLAKYRWLHGYNYNKVRRGGSPTNQP